MIYGFFGDVGSGKTLTMTKYVYLFYKLGYNVYSNYHLEFPHTKIDRDYLMKIVEEDKDFEGKNVFAIDEMSMYMDSRKSTSQENVIISYFIKQVRKKDVTLLYTEQMRHAVDKRLRGLTRTEIVCNCKSIKVYSGDKEIELVFIYNDLVVNGQVKGRMRTFGNRWFDYYDTKELITE